VFFEIVLFKCLFNFFFKKMQLLRLLDIFFSTESIGLTATSFGIIYHASNIDITLELKSLFNLHTMIANIDNLCIYVYRDVIFSVEIQN